MTGPPDAGEGPGKGPHQSAYDKQLESRCYSDRRWQRPIEAAADEALATNSAVSCEGMTVVPDTIMIDAVANGFDPAEAERTWRLRRCDGRMVYLYKTPEELR